MKKSINTEFFNLKKENTHVMPLPEMEWMPSHLVVKAKNTNSEEAAQVAQPDSVIDLKNQFVEFQNLSKLRIERLQNSLQKLENNQNMLTQELAEKTTLLLQKLNEQKKYDQKVQDMIDRHNNLLKGYEVRMNQLQKLLQQKETDYSEALVALRDTKAEISRLKRL